MIIIKKKFVKHLQKACGTPVKSQCLRLFRRNRTEGNRRTTKGSSFLQIREEEEADVTGKSEASVIGREGRGPRIGRRLIGRSVLEGSRDSGIRLHTFLPGGLAAASAVVVWTPARGRRHGFVLFGEEGCVASCSAYGITVTTERATLKVSLTSFRPGLDVDLPGKPEKWLFAVPPRSAGDPCSTYFEFLNPGRDRWRCFIFFSLSLSLYLS